jgi:type I restriction enzyme, S subunit
MLMDGARSSLVVYSEKGAVGSTLALIETKKIPSSLLFHYLKVRFELLQVNNTGAAIPHANKSFINKMEIIVPVDEVLLKWEEIINSINEEVYNLEDQNKLLKESRDILLPRLMTGMIDVDKMNIEV